MRSILSTRLIPALLGACALASAGLALAADPASSDATQSTRAAKRAEFQQRMFDKIDTNHDGLISRAEYQAFVDARFDKLDTNGNGLVTADEIADSQATRERARKRAEAFVKRNDPSGSGNVSKGDFEAKAMQRFDRMSGGGDTVTAAQFAAQRGHHGHGRMDTNPAKSSDG